MFFGNCFMLYSNADPTGITVTLTGGNGIFKKYIYFTSDESTTDKLQINTSNDTITVVYSDSAPAGNKYDSSTWATGYSSLSLGVKYYYSYNDDAIINLYDSDLCYYDYEAQQYTGDAYVYATITTLFQILQV